MEFRGKKVLIDKVRNGSAVEVELYYHPESGKTYQVDKEVLEFREETTKGREVPWQRFEEEEGFLASLRKDPQTILKITSETVLDALKSVQDTYNQSDVKKKIDKASKQAMQALEQTKVPHVAKKSYEAVDKTLDTFTGQKVLELVEERLTLQSRYNDILATKLDEALKRIEKLEAMLSKIQDPRLQKK